MESDALANDSALTAADPGIPVLEMRGIRKIFPGVVALDDVDFDAYAGEVHALLGENGAGKSTLIKIIAGVYRQDDGTMRVGGEEVEFRNPADALAQRIKVVYQELDLVDGLSVAENVFLGGYPKTARGFVDFAALKTRTRDLLAELGLEIDPDLPLGELRVAEQQLVEIARALSRQARLIVMDEPTSALSPAEVETLFAVIERLKLRGVAIIYVSHKLEEIYRIADRVTVFRDGKRVVTESVAATTPRQLVTWMVGRDLQDLFPKSEMTIGQPLLVVDRLSGSGLRDVSLTVHAGEIVGIFGLMGAGINTLGRVVFGAARRDGGVVTLDGTNVRPNAPRDAIAKGMGLLTESRKDDGLVLPLSVRNNMTLAALRRSDVDSAKSRDTGRSGLRGPARNQDSLPAPTDPLSQRRQSTEGADGALAATPGVPEATHPGRADKGHRRRLEGRDLPPDRRHGAARHGNPLHVDRNPGDPRYRRPHPGHA